MQSKTILRSGAACWAMVAGLSAVGGAGHAQTAAAPAPSTTAVGEVIVTAQRRAQRIQDVPIAITNLSKDQLVKEQVFSTADIPRLVPNMFTTNNTGTGSANVYFLRGLGQTESFATFDPQVGIYVDDIYIGRSSAANFGLFDVDQIQVLRGPQGTLFGRNSTGGAFVISLQKPTDTFGGYVEAGYGAYNRFSGQASINIPINDQILTKTTAYSIRDDGYVSDVATGAKLNFHNDQGIREAVTIQPSAHPNVTWNLSADTSQSKYNAEQDEPLNGKRVSYSGFGVLSSPTAVVGGAPIVADFNAILKEPFTDLPNGEDMKTWGAMSNFQVKFAAGTLNLITGLRGQDQLGAADFPLPIPGVTGSIVPYDENYLGQFGIVLNSTDRQYSQEVKWNGDFGNRLKYTAGLFYLYEENTTDFIETLTLEATPPPTPSVLGIEDSAPEHFHNTTSSTAAYLQGDYSVTDKLTLTLGGRVTNEHKTYAVNSPYSGGGYDTADVVAAGHSDTLLATVFTPRIVLQYKFDPDLMAFASATKGFQGGGWNSLTNSPSLVTAFKPETVWTYETGIRSELLDRKLILNGDIFYEDVQDYQLITLGPGGGANFVTENAAALSAYGLEADFTYRPIPDFTLGGNLGLQQGGYYDPSAITASQQAQCKAAPMGGDCTQGIVNASGGLAPPEDFPHASFALNGAYDFHASAFDLSPSAGVQFTSLTHVDTSGAVDGESGSHATLDMGLRFQEHNMPWYATVECENCLNQHYQTQLLFVKYYNTPGVWDVKVRYKF